MTVAETVTIVTTAATVEIMMTVATVITVTTAGIVTAVITLTAAGIVTAATTAATLTTAIDRVTRSPDGHIADGALQASACTTGPAGVWTRRGSACYTSATWR